MSSTDPESDRVIGASDISLLISGSCLFRGTQQQNLLPYILLE
jgi:hypothetical protein